MPVPSWTHPGLAETNRLGLSNGAQVEAVCRRLDVMLTTRLHGMVLALKNGVPVIAIDPVAGGDKVTRQARLLGWNEVFEADLVTDEAVAAALERCLSEEGRARASLVKEAAIRSLADFDVEFAAALQVPTRPELRGPRSRPRQGSCLAQEIQGLETPPSQDEGWLT